MPWVKIDEAFARHPKIMNAGPLGMALHVAALCYCNQYLTDGFVPKAAARTLVDFEDFGGSKTVIKDLVNNGLWDEEPDGYRLHDYHKYQPTKQQVEEQRSKKQAAGAAGGQASAEAKRQADAQAKSKPVPVSGSVPDTEPKISKALSPEATFETFWDRYPRHHLNGKPGGGGAKNATLRKWKRLTPQQRDLCLIGVEHYRADAERGDASFVCHATTWLNEERWADWQEPADYSQARAPAAPRDPYREMGERLLGKGDTDGQMHRIDIETRRSLPAGQSA